MSDGVRAVRNNNPGNIEKGAPWQGLMPREDMTEEQLKEKRFCVFKAPSWGFRAMAVTLITYQDKYKIHTIRAAISRWAPGTENDTESYIRAVDRAHPRKSGDSLDMHSYDDLAPLCKAIATHECGGWFFHDRDIDLGLKRAGVIPRANVGTMSKDRGVQAGSVATASTAGSGFMEMIGEAQDQFSDLALYLDIAKYALLGLALLSFGLFMWAKYRELKA